MAQTSICRGVKTSVVCTTQGISVVYHNTRVVDTTLDKIILNTGGWKTVTTKTRMNQASNQFGLGYSVYQKKGDWFVEYRGQTIPFDGDELVLDRTMKEAA